MKNSIFIFAAALFLMTSCTLSQEDTPQPIDQTEQYDYDFRDKITTYDGTAAELSEKKNRSDVRGKQNYRARMDTLRVSGSAYASKKGIAHEGVSAITTRSYRENSFAFNDAKVATKSGDNQQKGGPSKEGFGSAKLLTVIPNKNKMD